MCVHGTSQGSSTRRQYTWGWQAGAGEGVKGEKTRLRDGTGNHTFKPASVSNVAIRQVGLLQPKGHQVHGRHESKAKHLGMTTTQSLKINKTKLVFFNSRLGEEEGEGTGKKNTAVAGATGPHSDGSLCPAKYLSPRRPGLS